MDYEIIPSLLTRGNIYYPIGVESLYYFSAYSEKNSTTYLKCYFSRSKGKRKVDCRGTAFIKNEKLLINTPCTVPHPEAKATIFKNKKRAAFQDALRKKSEETTLREVYEKVENE